MESQSIKLKLMFVLGAIICLNVFVLSLIF